MSRCLQFCAGPPRCPRRCWKSRGRHAGVARQGPPDGDEPPQPGGCGVAQHAEQTCGSLLGVSADYAVLFLQGGASTQFAAVPLNLLGEQGACRLRQYRAVVEKGDCRGHALRQGQRGGLLEDTNFHHPRPAAGSWAATRPTCTIPNETIGGWSFSGPRRWMRRWWRICPPTILSRPINVDDSASSTPARKNIGPAGLTTGDRARDLLGRASAPAPPCWTGKWRPITTPCTTRRPPSPFTWRTWCSTGSGTRRPGGDGGDQPAQGGKALPAIDSSSLYANPVELPSRSLMNVPFTPADRNWTSCSCRNPEAAGC